MTQVKQPSKEATRAYLQRRRVEKTPPPTPEEIRRQLGWELIKGAECAR